MFNIWTNDGTLQTQSVVYNPSVLECRRMCLNIKTRPVVFSLLEIIKAQREADLIKCRLPLTVPLSPKLLNIKAGKKYDEEKVKFSEERHG